MAAWHRLLSVLSVLLLGATLAAAPAALGSSSPDHPTPQWAPADEASVHPGVVTDTEGRCTSNFVFYDTSDIYIGQSAHCASTSESTETNGCVASTAPVGSQVDIEGATQPGTMVYNSWVTMQAAGEQSSNACRYNDFALVRIDPADHGRVNPTVPVWGGPTGIATSTAQGDEVYSYGSSPLRLGIRTLSPKEGISLGQAGGGWTHKVYTATPGIPGDSGSAFIDAHGRGFGVLSTIEIAPTVGSNGVSDLSRMLAYMERHTGLWVTLALGDGHGPEVSGGSADDRIARACPDGEVPPGGYHDTGGNPHEAAIDCITWWGITSGVAPGRYEPGGEVRRDQMASFVARTLEAVGVALPPPSDQGFSDIRGNAHEDRINQLAAIGVVRGTSDTTYSPAATVRRDQMASFIVRSVEHATGEPMASSGSHFADTRGNTHEEAIDKVAEARIAAGTTATTYSPSLPARRDQMASFLARTLDLFVHRGDVEPPSG
ncbi:MAG TPA: S-layer homology domain-containing protein [Acidimicrobiales bacterium]|nr:S-layer homology domain-containing protein [Acidimicrobiales bacterium]